MPRLCLSSRRLSFRRQNVLGVAVSMLLALGSLAGSPQAVAADPVEAGAGAPAQSEPAPAAEQDDEYYTLFREFVETFEQIDRNYVKEVDRKELMRAAIAGMVTRLDPYSNYIPPDNLAEFTEGIEQEFGGIGIHVQIDPQTRRLVVLVPLPGTPAAKGGVRAGDVIMEIAGKSTEGFAISDAVEKLKGPIGDKVTIGVLHAGSETVEQIDLVREIIHVPTVLGDHFDKSGRWNYMLAGDEKIAYMRLTHFGRRTAEELRDALQDAKKQGMKGLVLDLRNNPGGLLSQAVEVCDLFLKSGKIVSTKGRSVPERSYEAHEPGTFSGFPMAVLINRFSASASEIVSACLQDHDRAVVVGERSWGKGSVQNVIELGGGASALKLTTASYLRPSGKNIHRFPDSKEDDEWGVTPNTDYLLKLSDDDLRAFLIARSRRDVLGTEGTEQMKDSQLDLALKYLREKLTN